jgi:hypothetical protein
MYRLYTSQQDVPFQVDRFGFSGSWFSTDVLNMEDKDMKNKEICTII